MEDLWKLYFNLPSESFSLILRNMDIMDRMTKIWRNVASGEEKASWSGYTSDIYNEMFKTFLRPLEILTGKKLSEDRQQVPQDFLEAWLKMMTPFPSPDVASYFSRVFECYVQFFKAWYEFSSKLNEVGFSILKEFLKENPGDEKERTIDLPSEWFKKWEEVYQNWFDFAPKYLGFSFKAEDLFLLPKEAVKALYESSKSYVELQKSWVEYSTKLFSMWQQAGQRFTEEIIKKKGSSNPGHDSLTFQELFKTWMSSFSSVFDSMLASSDYVQAQSKMVGHLADFIKHQREFYESFLGANPVLPFVYRSEGDINSQRYFLLNRRIREMEKKNEEFMQALEEIKMLAKKKGGAEKKIEEAEKKEPDNS